MSDVTIAVVRGDGFVSVYDVANGKHYTLDDTHINYEDVIKALDSGDDELALRLTAAEEAILDFVNGTNLEFDKGMFHYKGEVLDNVLTRRIIAMKKEGKHVDPMVKFLDNLLSNPSSTAVKELYQFLENHDFPFTADGHFLAYKIVTHDYKDKYTKTIDNSPGTVVEMARNLVDDNRHNTCSHGLHFCSEGYLGSYGRPDIDRTSGDAERDRVVIVKINPADVVAIPTDYNYAKGRAWRYQVLGEFRDMRKDLKRSVLSQ